MGKRGSQHVTINTARLLGKPADKGSGITDFTASLSEWLALFRSQNLSQGLFIFLHQIVPGAKHIRTFEGCLGFPPFLCLLSTTHQLFYRCPVMGFYPCACSFAFRI